MAGLLDKNVRVIDMVLTGVGRRLLSQGELRFVYWMPFDDEVDYSPYISQSGTMTPQQLSSSVFDQIEASLVREAVNGYVPFNVSGSDFTNVHLPVYTMTQGQTFLPRMTASDGIIGSASIVASQRKISDLHVKRDANGNVVDKLGPYDRGYQRFDATVVDLSYGYTPGSFPPDHQYSGFRLQVFASGAEGIIELSEKRDLNNETAFGNELKIIPGGAG